MIRAMDWKEAYLRSGGGVLAVLGIVLILISGELVSGTGIDMPQRTAEFVLRAGFGAFLIGILMVFLFSFRTVPLELTSSFLLTQGRNMGRMLEALNLDGKGTYMPMKGRLLEDRVYVPLEKEVLPLPDLAKEMVFNVGTTGPSMGISLLPPGLDLVNRVESDCGRSFRDDTLAEADESMERLGKGIGLYKDIRIKVKERNVELTIEHSRLKETCDILWEEHPHIHEQIGCPACSAVLCAASRVIRSPLRIFRVSREKGKIIYILERM
jgi:hypothetical protein